MIIYWCMVMWSSLTVNLMYLGLRLYLYDLMSSKLSTHQRKFPPQQTVLFLSRCPLLHGQAATTRTYLSVRTRQAELHCLQRGNLNEAPINSLTCQGSMTYPPTTTTTTIQNPQHQAVRFRALVSSFNQCLRPACDLDRHERHVIYFLPGMCESEESCEMM